MAIKNTFYLEASMDNHLHAAVSTLTNIEELMNLCSNLSKKFAVRAPEYDREGKFPLENFQDLKDNGLLGIMVPKEYGGIGADFSTYTHALELLSAGDASTGLTFNMHNITIGSLAELNLEGIGGGRGRIMNEFRDWMFDQAVNHKKLFASASSEPKVGASFSNFKTSYKRVDGGFLINGVKAFVSMAGYADYYVVAARSEDAHGDTPALSFLVVERDNPGIRIEEIWDTLGMRGTSSNTMYLNDCFVPQERLFLGSEGMALFKIVKEPHWLVGGYNGVYLGICTAIFDFLKEYLNKKMIPGSDTSVVQNERIQHTVGELYVELEAARVVTYDAARLVAEQAGTPEANVAIHRAKYMVSELGPRLASNAIRLCGGSTIAKRLPLERFYRDARCGGLMPATSDNCLIYVGKAALGADLQKPSETYW